MKHISAQICDRAYSMRNLSIDVRVRCLVWNHIHDTACDEIWDQLQIVTKAFDCETD